MKTIKLFDNDGTVFCFEATVLSCEPCERGFAVELDATAFAPEAGGQPSDTGRLGSAEVLAVGEQGERLLHYTDAPLTPGQKVQGCLDEEKRWRHIQNHTAEHIVTALFHNLYGMTNVGFHLGHEDVTLDLDGTVTEEMIRRVERMANVVVREDRAVTAIHPTPEELEKMSFRSKKELSGDVRIVLIEDLDACACCTPHVKTTGQVGGIRLLEYLRYKGGTRIHLKAGLDALDEGLTERARLEELSHLLSLPGERIVEGVEKLQADLGAERHRAAEMRERMVALLLKNPPENGIYNMEGFDLPELRTLAQSGGRLLALGGSEGAYKFVLCDPTPSYAETVQSFREALGASGGGKPPLMQGSVSASFEKIAAVFAGGN